MPATWTPPRTWVDGETPTGGQFNTQIRDNLLFLKETPVIDGNLNVTGDVTTVGDITVGDDAVINSDLHVLGNTQLDGHSIIGNAPADTMQVNATVVGAPLQTYTETRTTPAIAAGALALDCALGTYFKVALNAAITAITFTNLPAAGRVLGITLIFVADGTVRAITWPASVKWPSGVAPTMSGASGKIDVITLITDDGGVSFIGVIVGQLYEMPLAKAYRHRPTGLPVQYLICGGGGAGGHALGSGRCAGGGGGGQVVTGSQTLVSLTAYPVVIGVGGHVANPPVDLTNQGFPGGNTTFLGLQGGGGGGGGGGTGEGQPDHNGGFGPPGSSGPGGGGGTPEGVGVNGGANANGTNDVAGGGGGQALTATAPNGSGGVVSSITGTATPYGSGGGGGTNLGTVQGGTGGNGGAGGTGAGEFGGALVPTAFGGGGGGSSRLGGNETAGRQGVVIVSYDGLTVRASGGAITQAIGRTIHTFTANGTFTTI